MSELTSILVIDDEAPIRTFLRSALEGEGFSVIDRTTGEGGREVLTHEEVDVVLLDLGLPDIDGVALTRSLRPWCSVPIVVLSARGQEADKVAALDAGADDYLTKPFGVGELLARIRVALRHTSRKRVPLGRVSAGEFTIDLVSRRVIRGQDQIHLTPNEYGLLAALARNAGRVVTHRQLMKEVWGEPYSEEIHYLRIYMRQLRHKLEANPAQPRVLITEPGVGYRLNEE